MWCVDERVTAETKWKHHLVNYDIVFARSNLGSTDGWRWFMTVDSGAFLILLSAYTMRMIDVDTNKGIRIESQTKIKRETLYHTILEIQIVPFASRVYSIFFVFGR